jgi:FkbM family methyltransferase
MTFISYAQNFEDVMLFRALKGVEKGFYIDVGAQDPVFDSVTKAFYERGWRGINIEPVEQWFGKLVADRPKDVNLQLAASSQTGNVRFFEVRNTGMSTSDIDFARLHATRGFEVREYEIPAKPLDAICAEFGVKEVHFLKVDVEGAEAEVLRGIGLTDIRPWIILVEATEPNSQVSTHEEWEHLLTSRGYEFAYFDGLNRFYVAREHAGFKNTFSIPPNFFDNYIRYPEWLAGQRASRLEGEREAFAQEAKALREQLGRTEAEREAFAGEANSLRGMLEETRQEAKALREQLGRTEAEREAFAREADSLRRTVEEMYKSLSMRITGPLRAFKRRFPVTVHLYRNAWNHLTKIPRRALRGAGWRAANHPALRGLARRLLRRWPRLRWHIKQFLLVTPQEAVLRQRADNSGPPLVPNNPSTGHVAPAAQTSGEYYPKDGVSQFAVIESMQAVVDVEALRARIARETERRQ